MSPWQQTTAAEHSETIAVAGTVEQARAASREAAHDMGLTSRREGSSPLLFTDRGGMYSWTVDVMADVSEQSGRTVLYIGGFSPAGRSARQREYVVRLVGEFARRVEREMSSPPNASIDTRRKRRRDRAIVSLLGRVKWLAVGLLIPMILIPLLLWGGHERKFGWFVIGYFAFALSVPTACEIVRRRRVGTGSRYDYVELAVLVAVAILLLVAGFIRFS